MVLLRLCQELAISWWVQARAWSAESHTLFALTSTGTAVTAPHRRPAFSSTRSAALNLRLSLTVVVVVCFICRMTSASLSHYYYVTLFEHCCMHRLRFLSDPIFSVKLNIDRGLWNQFSRDHCRQGRSYPGYREVGSVDRNELATDAIFQPLIIDVLRFHASP